MMMRGSCVQLLLFGCALGMVIKDATGTTTTSSSDFTESSTTSSSAPTSSATGTTNVTGTTTTSSSTTSSSAPTSSPTGTTNATETTTTSSSTTSSSAPTSSPTGTKNTVTTTPRKDECYNHTCTGSEMCLTNALTAKGSVTTCPRSDKFCRIERINKNSNFTVKASCSDTKCTFNTAETGSEGQITSNCCDANLCNTEVILKSSTGVLRSSYLLSTLVASGVAALVMWM